VDNTPFAKNMTANALARQALVGRIACNQVCWNTNRASRNGYLMSIVCGSLADGKNRPMRSEPFCECEEGWTGINCNVCTSNKACNALMPEGEGGVCYRDGEVVKENYQMCDVTNQKIVEMLDGKVSQVTFTCEKEDETCAFQCKPKPLILNSAYFYSLG
jgi:hypothetical protein